MRRKKGFTLLELIIVIIVIGILASIALPRYLKVAEKSRLAEGKSILGAIRGAQMRYAAEHGNYTDDCSFLDTELTTYRYFDEPSQVCARTGDIGTVTRNTVDAGNFVYTIGITQDGNFSCTGGSCGDVGM